MRLEVHGGKGTFTGLHSEIVRVSEYFSFREHSAEMVESQVRFVCILRKKDITNNTIK